VRKIGEVNFGKGEWEALKVPDAWNVHDGTVMGVSHFECPAGKGVFAQFSKCSSTFFSRVLLSLFLGV